jgi:hypothetical protein
MKKLFFDNKGSRFAKAVDHFAPLCGFHGHPATHSMSIWPPIPR